MCPHWCMSVQSPWAAHCVQSDLKATWPDLSAYSNHHYPLNSPLHHPLHRPQRLPLCPPPRPPGPGLGGRREVGQIRSQYEVLRLKPRLRLLNNKLKHYVTSRKLYTLCPPLPPWLCATCTQSQSVAGIRLASSNTGIANRLPYNLLGYLSASQLPTEPANESSTHPRVVSQETKQKQPRTNVPSSDCSRAGTGEHTSR